MVICKLYRSAIGLFLFTAHNMTAFVKFKLFPILAAAILEFGDLPPQLTIGIFPPMPKPRKRCADASSSYSSPDNESEETQNCVVSRIRSPYYNKMVTTIMIRPLDDRTYCARSAFTHMRLSRKL